VLFVAEVDKLLNMRNQVCLLVLCLLMTACAKKPAENANEPKPIASTDVVEATPQEASLTRGQSGEVLVPIKIANGYHINANPPSFPYLKATELQVPPAHGISVEFITYPDAVKKTFSFAETPLAVYEGEAVVKARLKADQSAQIGKHNLSAKLRVQACDDKVCYAPGVLDVLLPVNVQ
jgi:Disulphide bond corrector protein DsbC